MSSRLRSAFIALVLLFLPLLALPHGEEIGEWRPPELSPASAGFDLASCRADTRCRVITDGNADGDMAAELRRAWHELLTTQPTAAFWRFEMGQAGTFTLNDPVRWCFDATPGGVPTALLNCDGLGEVPHVFLGRSFDRVRFVCDVRNDWPSPVVGGGPVFAGDATGPGYCFRFGDSWADGVGETPGQVIRTTWEGRPTFLQTFSIIDIGAVAADYTVVWIDGATGVVRYSVGSQDPTKFLLAGQPTVIAGVRLNVSVHETGPGQGFQNWADYMGIAAGLGVVVFDTNIGEGHGVGLGTTTAFGARIARTTGTPLLCRYGEPTLTYNPRVVYEDTVTAGPGSYGFEPFCYTDVVWRGVIQSTGQEPIDDLTRGHPTRARLTVEGPLRSNANTNVFTARNGNKDTTLNGIMTAAAQGDRYCIQHFDQAVWNVRPARYPMSELFVGDGYYCRSLFEAKDFIQTGQLGGVVNGRAQFRNAIRAWNQQDYLWRGNPGSAVGGNCANFSTNGYTACTNEQTRLRFEERTLVTWLQTTMSETPPTTGCEIVPQINGAALCVSTTQTATTRSCWLDNPDFAVTYNAGWNVPFGPQIRDRLRVNYDPNPPECLGAGDPYEGCSGAGAGTIPVQLNAAGQQQRLVINKVFAPGDFFSVQLTGAGCTDYPESQIRVRTVPLRALQNFRGGAQCDDGVDNDADGFVDLDDPQCANKADNDESA